MHKNLHLFMASNQSASSCEVALPWDKRDKHASRRTQKSGPNPMKILKPTITDKLLPLNNDIAFNLKKELLKMLISDVENEKVARNFSKKCGNILHVYGDLVDLLANNSRESNENSNANANVKSDSVYQKIQDNFYTNIMRDSSKCETDAGDVKIWNDIFALGLNEKREDVRIFKIKKRMSYTENLRNKN